jgi:hypothetical protein
MNRMTYAKPVQATVRAVVRLGISDLLSCVRLQVLCRDRSYVPMVVLSSEPHPIFAVTPWYETAAGSTRGTMARSAR